MGDVEHQWHLSLLIQIFADECKREYEGSQSHGWGDEQQRGHVNKEISFREPLINQEMPVAPDTKKEQKFRFQIVFRDYLFPQDFVPEQALPAFATWCWAHWQHLPSLQHWKLFAAFPSSPGMCLWPQAWSWSSKGTLWGDPYATTTLRGCSAGVLMATGGVKWAGPAGLLGAVVTSFILLDSHSSKIPWTHVCLTFGIWWRVLSLIMPSSHTIPVNTEEEYLEGKTLRDSGLFKCWVSFPTCLVSLCCCPKVTVLQNWELRLGA